MILYRFFVACVVLACAPASAFAQTPDTTPPHTTLTVPPPRITIQYQPFSVQFEADEPATFECRTFAGPWTPCTSPRYYANEEYPGEHLYVRATDTAGNVETTPAHALWTTNWLTPDVGPSVTGTFEPGRQLTCHDPVWPVTYDSMVKTWHPAGAENEVLGVGDTYTLRAEDVKRQVQCAVDVKRGSKVLATVYTWAFPEVLYVGLPASTPCASSTANSIRTDDPAGDRRDGIDILNVWAMTDARCGFSMWTAMDTLYSGRLYYYLDTDGNTGQPAIRRTSAPIGS